MSETKRPDVLHREAAEGLEPVTLDTVVAAHLRSFDRWSATTHNPEDVTPGLRARVYRECATHAGLLAVDARALLEERNRLLARADGAERRAKEAEAKATECRGHLRYEVERRQELERAVAALRAQIETGPAFDAAARANDGAPRLFCPPEAT